MNDDLIDKSLRALDPMPHEVPAGSLRAQRSLDSIIAGRPSRRFQTRTATRVALATGMAAALALGAVIVPGMSGTPTAYADWTTTATPISRDQALTGMGTCFDKGTDVPAQAPDVIVGEKRGPWTFISLSWPNGENASCLFRTAPQTGKNTLGMGFFRGDPVEIGGRPLPVPSADSIEANGLLTLEQPEGDIHQLTGAAGADVTRVVIHAGQLGDVEATIEDDRFVAWWPEARISPVLPFDPDVTLHLRDGSTVTKELSDFTHIQR